MARPTSDRVSVRPVPSRRLTPFGAFYREWDATTKQRERRSRYFETEAAARAFAATKTEELRRVTGFLAKLPHKIAPAAGMTFGEYVAERYMKIHLPRRKGGTYESYERQLRLHILPVAGDVPLTPETFTNEVVEAVVTSVREKGFDWSGQMAAIRCLGAVLQWTCPPLGKLLPANPCRGMLKALKDENWTEAPPNPLTYEEQGALLTWIETGAVPEEYDPLPVVGDLPVESLTRKEAGRRRWPAVRGGYRQHFEFFLLLLHTGLRRGEATALRWDAIYLDTAEPYLMVNRGYSRAASRLARLGHKQYAADGMVKPKTGKERTVWLSPELADALRALARTRRAEALRDRRPVSPFVFPRPNCPSRPVTYDVTTKVLAAALVAIGLQHGRRHPDGRWQPFTMHALRDTFATVNLLNGTPLPWVSAMLGHKKRSITWDRYSAWVPGQKAGAQYVAVMQRQPAAPAVAVAGGATPAAAAAAASRARGAGRSALREVPKRR